MENIEVENFYDPILFDKNVEIDYPLFEIDPKTQKLIDFYNEI